MKTTLYPVKKKILIIGLSALPGGGKDYVADLLSKKYGFYKVSPGEIIREKLSKIKKGKITRKEQQELQNKLRDKYGKDFVMELCLKKIKKAKKDKVAIAGIRFPNDILFYKRLHNVIFYNIFIYASSKVRFKRTMDRKRADAPTSYKKFLEEDKKEDEIFNIKETERMSDFKVDNNKDNSKGLERKIGKIIDRINSSIDIHHTD